MQHAQLAWVLAAGLALCGCASPEALRRQAQADPNDDFDAVKVATVTQWAQTHGATVVWLHYPTKRRSGDGRD